jgi:arylsulfatase A-like enzyme/Flp pilus assembly protein TadD
LNREKQSRTKWVFLATLLLGILVAFLLWKRPSFRPNLLLITVDTLRADRLGAYGWEPARTPVMDRLAAEGIRFENAFTSVPVTLAAHATLLTGRLPPEHGVRSNSFYRLSEEETTLAEILRAEGYRTAAVVGAAVLDGKFGLAQGFDFYDDAAPTETGRTLIAERPAAAVVDVALAWLAGREPGPFFLWVHLFDPHDPYHPPEPFRSAFPASPYDGEIAYVDRELGRLLAALDERAERERTLVVLTADHGESLGEHGEATHGIFLYDATLRVPFILAGPGLPRRPPAVSDPVGLVDVTPTLLGCLKLASPGPFSGRDLFAPAGERRELFYVETFLPRDFYNWSPLRGLRSARLKFVEAPIPELYDLEADPRETRNLAAERERELKRLAAALGRFTTASDEGESLSVDAALRERLESLGYVAGGARPGPLRPGAPDPKTRIHLVARLDEVLALTHARRPAEALPLLQAILKEDADNYLAAHTLADTLFDLGRDRDAVAAYERVLASGREAGYYRYRLGLLHERLKDYPRAAAAFARLSRSQPEAAKEVLERGDSLLQQGSAQGALLYYQALAEAGAGGAALSLRLADVQLRLGRLREAREALAPLLDPPPSDSEIRSATAGALKGLGAAFGEKGDLAAASEAFSRAASLAPSDFEALANLGLTEVRRGREASGLEAVERALALRPDEVRLLNLAGELHFRRRDYERARERLKRSLELNPAQPRIVRALEEVEAASARSR